MSDLSSKFSEIAERYAASLFELALEAGNVEAVESDLAGFEALLESSDDLSRLIVSPVFSADDQFRAIDALLKKAGMTGLVGNFLRVVARNRRLFAVPGMIRAFRHIAAEHRGEVTASVISAHALSAEQTDGLKASLRQVAGKTITLEQKVDASLLGGLIVQLGSRQFDTSLKTKLNSLKLALKGVG